MNTTVADGTWTTAGYPLRNDTMSNNTLIETAFKVISGSGNDETNFAAANLTKDIDQVALLWPYAVHVLISVSLGLLSVFAGTTFIVMASKNLYNAMFLKILWAPLRVLTPDKAGRYKMLFSANFCLCDYYKRSEILRVIPV